MAGLFPSKKRVIKSLNDWKKNVELFSWEGNNVHIDELLGLNSLDRDKWIVTSFELLDIVNQTVGGWQGLLLFLHIALKSLEEEQLVSVISLDWLTLNIDDYTPPSFNFTTIEYFESFYNYTLEKVVFDESILEILKFKSSYHVYLRQHFDNEECLYSRELYIFCAN